MTTRRAACALTVLANMASRLQLRPTWPMDSDPDGPDPAEDE